MCELKARYQQVLLRIAQACEQSQRSDVPKLLAVSKKHSLDDILLLATMGQVDFGESYAQEGIEKIIQCLEASLVWHFIGPIQSNKAKLIAENFSWVHSVDRLKVLKKIVAHRSPHSEPINILLQLKIGDEVTKSGATFNEIIEMAEYLLESDAAILRGLMCIPPPSSQRGTQERYFKEAKKAFDTLQKSHASVDTLSMGMSGDLEAAINCGSTVVRVGTDIFGRRA